MGNSYLDLADSSSTRPRFSMGRIAGGGVVACLWLWTSAASLRATTVSEPVPATAYQGALERFNHADYPRALKLLAQAPAGGDVHEQADILNLRGAILLREHRDDDARAAFGEAVRLDPGLLAARFNAVEVSFREKRYAESSRQFRALLAQTSRPGHTSERLFIEYKLMLSELLDGQEKAALDFIDAHRGDESRPLAWYYLNAALEFQHGRAANGSAWLQQAGTRYAGTSQQVFADSFAPLGWTSHGESSERLASRGDRARTEAAAPMEAAPARLAKEPATRGARTRPPTPGLVAVPATIAEALPVRDLVTLAAAPARSKVKGQATAPAKIVSAPGLTIRKAEALTSSTMVAVVSLIPDQAPAPSAQIPAHEDANGSGPRPAFHFDGPAAPSRVVEQMPPSEVGLILSSDELANPAHLASAPGVLARGSGHKAKTSPSPSASPASGDTAAASSPLPSPDASAGPSASPVGTPSPAFIQKYEAAMVQFLQKDYPGAKKLLDEADAIQPGEPQSATLRNQLFKQYYESAYSDYQHADYPAALTQLDGADGAGASAQNQSDAYNLRGLVLSKQRNYEGAENMFHKAIQTDPGLWAAKFNFAEVPFNYRNFTVARSRFEELFAQTDPVKQPVEAELTQFKVFLTLLLEGKEDAARTFMQHFNFSGATPARYFCQASLNFYSGDVDKAQGWIDSARKEYPPRKSSSFLEAFYRVGWLTDPNTPPSGAPSTAVASASPAMSPGETVETPNPSPVVAAASPTALSTAKPSATPMIAAATPTAKPSASPVIAAATPTASPVAKPSASPMIAAATPTASLTAMPSASPMVASSSPAVIPAFRILTTPPPVAFSSPATSASPAPVLMAKASATPTPVPTVTVVAKSSATATPSPSATVVAKSSATPTPVPTATVVAKSSATATPSPSATVVAKATPTVAPASASPSATVMARSSSTASPTASDTVVAIVAPKPSPFTPAADASSPSPSESSATDTSDSTPAATDETAEEPASGGNNGLRWLLVVGVGAYFVYVVGRISAVAKGRKSKHGPTADASSSDHDRKPTEADDVDTKS